MTNELTSNEIEVLNALRSIYGESDMIHEGSEFKMVYLDNGISTDNKSVRGTLGSLEKKGYYFPEDGYAWGWVKA